MTAGLDCQSELEQKGSSFRTSAGYERTTYGLVINSGTTAVQSCRPQQGECETLAAYFAKRGPTK